MNSIKEEEQKAANPEEETMAQQQWVEYCQHGTMPKHLTQVYEGIALKRSNSSVQVGNVLETRNVALRRGVVAMVYFTVASQLASWKENLRKTKTKRFGTGNWFTKQKPNEVALPSGDSANAICSLQRVDSFESEMDQILCDSPRIEVNDCVYTEQRISGSTNPVTTAMGSGSPDTPTSDPLRPPDSPLPEQIQQSGSLTETEINQILCDTPRTEARASRFTCSEAESRVQNNSPVTMTMHLPNTPIEILDTQGVDDFHQETLPPTESELHQFAWESQEGTKAATDEQAIAAWSKADSNGLREELQKGSANPETLSMVMPIPKAGKDIQCENEATTAKYKRNSSIDQTQLAEIEKTYADPEIDVEEAEVPLGTTCCGFLPSTHPVRMKLFWLVHTDAFINGAVILIILSCIQLAWETYATSEWEDKMLLSADYAFTTLFFFEMVLKMLSDGVWDNDHAYFKSA